MDKIIPPDEKFTFKDDKLKSLRDACENDPDGKVKGYSLDFLALLHRLEAAEAIQSAERCPDCPDQGWYGFMHPRTQEAEQAECEFCKTNPKSRFHAIEAWRKSKGL